MQLPVRLASLAAALLATAVLTILMSASQGLGWTRISLPYMIGTVFSERRSWATAVGFALHSALGLAFALLYALVFEAWHHAGAWIGAGLGLLHGLFVLMVGLEVLSAFHPRMASRHHGPTPTRQLEPPGFMALNYGWRTPLVTLVAHVAYGAIFGALYAAAP
jgi:uncharacterized membrane protein YagU involved in acid resistance